MKTKITPDRLLVSYLGMSEQRIRYAVMTLIACLLGFPPPAWGQDPYLYNTNYPMDANASAGGPVTFRVYASSAFPPLSYQWQHEGTNLPAATNVQLVIANVTVAHAGNYLAWVSNASGGFTNSRTATLTVHPPQFADVTVSAGVTNAPGYCISAAWGDYNNDLFIDLYLATGADTTGTNALFRNNGNGTFTRVGPQAGPIATDRHDSFGCAWIDFNNDGHRDMFVLNGGWSASRNDMYWNNGDGTFRRANAGNLTQQSQVRGWSAPADYDGDGWLDLYIPEGLSGSYSPRIYHATPYGTFTSFDLSPPLTNVNSGVWGDYDNDGDPDLFTCNSSAPGVLWRNDGGGQFAAATIGPPTALASHAAWADYDRDGDLDIAIRRSGNGSSLYRNDGASGFVLVADWPEASGILAWADYDNDGHLDVIINAGQNITRKPALYHNNGDGTFSRAVDVFTEVADNLLGCPWGDFDNDGFMDLVFGHQYGKHKLFRNLGNTNHWIKFKLIGTASNRDAIGAKVRVQATIAGQSVWQMQEVNGGYAMQKDTRLNFGLGDATNVDLVRIEWPSGNVQELSAQSVDRILTVTEQALITPVRPTASLNGSATMTRTALAGATYQWRLDGVDLVGQTNRILNLTNITADMAGRYSVVASNATALTTNFVYLFVDTQFTKITTETMCTDRGYFYGCAWGDYDNDGFSDLFVADGMWFRTTTNHLYHNNGDGTFARMTTADVGSVVGDVGGWRGCAWGDYDNDGFLDLYVTQDNGRRNLYHNNTGGGFTRVTTNGPLVTDAGYGHGVSWGDYDSDGLLDLFVATAPAGYHGLTGGNSLYHNKGDGTFTKVTTGPISADRPTGDPTFAGAWADFDNDGDLDLVVGGGTGPKFLYRNNGAGQFSKTTSGTLPQDSGYSLFFSWGDYDNDGLLDLFSGEWNTPCRLFHNNGGGQFSKMFFPPGSYETRGGVWGDYDNDGYLDLFIPIGGFSPGHSLLYHNNGDGTFTQITTGSLVSDYGHTSCAAWCDYDNDGFLDLFVDYDFDEPNSLFHNNGNNNSWLLFKLVGTRSNRAAIGAKVRVKATIGGKTFWQMREISGGDGVQNDMRPHFGLGNATVAQLVRIEWPSGAVQQLANVAVNQILTVCEPPALCAAVHADCSCELTIKAEPNRVWQVQASSDLLNWETLGTVTNLTYQFQYNDPDGANHTSRFYRVKAQ